jgi:hypothetical protein
VLGFSQSGVESPIWEYEAELGLVTIRFTFRNDRVVLIDWFREYD